jgi:hypothetical protein
MPPSEGQPIHLNFDLRLEPWQDGYRALVIDSPVSGGASSRFSLPGIGLSQAGQPGPGGQSAASRKLVPAGSAPPDQQAGPLAPAALGQALFEKVFQGEVLSFLRRSQDQVLDQGAAGLRIRLLLSDVPELAQLGWEYLYDASHAQFLCLSAQTPVVRYLDVLRSREPAAIDPPLQILVMISAPSDQPPLDVEGEWARLNAALAGLVDQKQVVVHRLDAATLGALQQQLRRGAFHVFHFIGHGAFDDQAQDGLLVFEDQRLIRHEGGWADYIERRKLAARDEQPAGRSGGGARSAPVAAQTRRKAKLTYAEELELDSLLERVDEAEQQVSALEAELAGADFYERSVAEQQAFFPKLELARVEATRLAERWTELEDRRGD